MCERLGISNYCIGKRSNSFWRCLIFWDGATYHDSEQFRQYLATINQGLEEEE